MEELEAKIKRQQLLRLQLDRLAELKKKTDQNIRGYKDDVMDMITTRSVVEPDGRQRGINAIKTKTMKFKRIPITSTRRPKMSLLYQAIENVLGQEALNDVKQEMKEARDRLTTEEEVVQIRRPRKRRANKVVREEGKVSVRKLPFVPRKSRLYPDESNE